MYAILLALPLLLINWSNSGLIYMAVYMFTGLICLQTEWSRNVMIGGYIVFGFWYMAGTSL